MSARSRIRVAHVVNTMGLGGVSNVVYELVRRLPGDRYEQSVYALRRATDNPDARRRQAERFAELDVTVRFPVDDAKKFTVVGEMCGWLLDDAIDVLHTHSYKPNIYGRIAGSLVASPMMVAHYHNVYDDKWSADGTLIYEQLLEPRTERMVACSAAVREHVAERLGVHRSRISLVPNGVDVERFADGGTGAVVRAQLGVSAREPLVGIVGRLSRQKAQDVFLHAAKLVLDRRADVTFVIAGGGQDEPLVEELHALAAALGIADHVRFAGHVADMPALYAALDVLAAPSRWEGYGLVLAEAMAAGLPIVASDIAAIREVTGDGAAAILVSPDDAEALAGGLLGVLDHPARAAELGGCGRAVAQRWSWDASAAALDDLYADLTHVGAAGPR